MNPDYPIYVISKGRWKNLLTCRALEYMEVPYKIVVEEQEFNNYTNYVNKSKILVLPKKYLDDYDTFWQDDDPKKGSGPARNFCWEHSLQEGFKRHWLMDDNIEAFHRLNRNIKAVVDSGTILKIMEDFVDRYENVFIAGPNYYSFVKSTDSVPAFKKNTRIYSCLLIQNDIPYRWRGRYNEDVDLSLRVLKGGGCTIQFNAFLQGKVTTQRMKGGNSEIYAGGTKRKSRMLVDMHPDVTKLVWRFSRWHHHVDYRPFEGNNLIKKSGIEIPRGVKEYGMKLSKKPEGPERLAGKVFSMIDSFRSVKFPIYIPSKQRSNLQQTTGVLDKNNLAYYLVVEPQDYEDYLQHYPDHQIIRLEKNNQGIFYVRNKCKEHSKATGAAYHWQIDDNIKDFCIRKNDKTVGQDVTNILSSVEYVMTQFTNVGISGLTHTAFAFSKKTHLSINRQAYSCVLVNNELGDLYWRDNVVEDTDYSLQVLSSGYCTLIFNKLMIAKGAASKNSGGNSNSDEWRMNRAVGLQKKWPDTFKIKKRSGLVRVLPSRVWGTFLQTPKKIVSFRRKSDGDSCD